MNICGIIAEYNPMHNGHLHHIEKARKLTKADYIILVLSGDFTQAGNISCIDKHTKAEIAIKYGVDLVIELQAKFSVSSSEYFCNSAITILENLNCVNSICFGTECKDVQILYSIANKLIKNEKAIWKDIKNSTSKNNFPSIRTEVLKNYLTSAELEEINKPNNILGIEYIKSIIKLNSNIKPYIIERIDGISSSKIRKNKLDDIDYLKNNTPLETSNYLIENNFLLNDKIYPFLRFKIISLGINKLKNINEVTEGLENKIYKEALAQTNYYDFIKNVKSKRYIESKIRRICLNILLEITKKDITKTSKNIKVLKINKDKKELLSYISKKSKLNIITKIDDTILDSYINSNKIYNIIKGDILSKEYKNKLDI